MQFKKKKEVDYKIELIDRYIEFLDEEKAGFKEYLEIIEEIKAKAKSEFHKDVFSAEGIESVELHFDNNINVHLATLSSFKENYVFGNEITINELKKAMNEPIDSFMPYYNDQGRYNDFERLTSKIKTQVDHLEYIVFLKTVNNKHPTWYGNTYQSGKYEGKLMLYRVENKELIAIIEVLAMSSGSVSAGSFSDLGEAAMADYYDNINSAVEAKLQNVVKINGKPSKLRSVE